MDKIAFLPAEGEEPEDFYILAQTAFGGKSYLLVTDEDPEGDAPGEAVLLRDDSAPEDAEALYTIVEDEAEQTAVLPAFRDLLEEEGVELEE